MERSNALKFKRIIFLLLAFIMAATLIMMVACAKAAPGGDGDGDEGDDTTTEDTEIVEVIKNGKFDQYRDTAATMFPVTPSSWTHAADSYAGNSANITSDYASYGIISVYDEYYTNSVNNDASISQTSSMKKIEKVLDNPESPFYDASKSLDDETNNDKILMVGNLQKTAMKYKSSSITVPINSYAIISVYVKTFLVDEDGEFYHSALNDGRGAVISLSGGIDKPVILSGISTDGEWKEYQVIIEGSNISSKSITLELGLGTGGPLYSANYTEGFAFFANAEMKFITEKEFNIYNDQSNPENSDVVIVEQFQNDEINYGSHKITDQKDTDKKSRLSYTFKNGNNLTQHIGEIADGWENLYSAGSNNGDFTITNNFDSSVPSNIPPSLSGKFENYPFTQTHITSIQKNNNNSTSAGIAKQNFFEAKEGHNYRISFWVKTSDMDRSGLNIYLTYATANGDVVTVLNKSVTNINTETYKLSKEDKEKVTNANLWDDWREYSFYVSADNFGYKPNELKTKMLSLEIWFGSININYTVNSGNIVPNYNVLGLNAGNFPESQSYAMLTNLQVQDITSASYSAASSAENSITGFMLSDKQTATNNITNGSFNNAATADKDVSDRPVAPASFTGMYGFGQNGLGSAPSGTQNVASGLINTNIYASYKVDYLVTLFGSETLLQSFIAISQNQFNSLLMIYNQQVTSFGYYSNLTLSANNIYEFSVMVRTKDIEGAKANIYLTDSDGELFYNYVKNEKGDKLSATSQKVLNPYYQEKYDQGSDSYNHDKDYESGEENKLLRRGEKYVIASTIPVENPFYEKNFEGAATWKREDEKYIVIANDYSDKAQFTKIESESGFTTFTFFIKTGEKSRNLQLHLWNGSKFLSEADYTLSYSKGAVFFDNAIGITIGAEEFYEFVLNGTIDETIITNAQYFDLSNDYTTQEDKIAAEEAAENVTEDEEETTGDKDKKPFDWGMFTVVLSSSLIVVALIVVMISKYLQNRKKAEKTVTEVPVYARKKNAKSSKPKGQDKENDSSDFK